MSDHRLLLVEDDDDVAGAAAAILESEGYTVTRATDGEDALRALRAGLGPCAIVLDLMMPGMNGIEFRRVQLGDPNIADVPVVVVSGVENMIPEIRAMHVARCFRKPVDWDQLLGVVNSICAMP